MRQAASYFRSVVEAEGRHTNTDIGGLLAGLWQRTDYSNELLLGVLNTLRVMVSYCSLSAQG